MEEAFEEVCSHHGFVPLVNGVIPQTDLKTFQPFHRCEIEGQGIIIGLAMMSEAKALPAKNMSRASGVSLNFAIQPSLFDDGAKLGDIFVLFLVEKDREVAGQLAEIAIGVIDAGYTQYLDYQPLEKYLQGYANGVEPKPDPQGQNLPKIRLKPNIKPYEPPKMSEDTKKVVGEDDQ
jgi:hypothetical protein